VTAETDEGPLEARRLRGVSALIERIEHDAGPFVVRCHLEEIAAAHPAECDAVVEEDGTGFCSLICLPCRLAREKTSSCESTGMCSASIADRR
jgi:hypothetical protein